MVKCNCGCDHRAAVWEVRDGIVVLRVWGGEEFGFRERLIELTPAAAARLARNLTDAITAPTSR